MEEIIHHILEVEEQAKKIVEGSDNDAQAIAERARSEARALVENARSDAHSQAAEILKEALRAAEETRQKRLDEIRRSAPSAETIDAGLRRAAMETVFARITGLSADRR